MSRVRIPSPAPDKSGSARSADSRRIATSSLPPVRARPDRLVVGSAEFVPDPLSITHVAVGDPLRAVGHSGAESAPDAIWEWHLRLHRTRPRAIRRASGPGAGNSINWEVVARWWFGRRRGRPSSWPQRATDSSTPTAQLWHCPALSRVMSRGHVRSVRACLRPLGSRDVSKQSQLLDTSTVLAEPDSCGGYDRQAF